MTENRANSGVRNLRAMFESQSAASSPEPRGRSPSRRINADTTRPTSKVKASFVSVEPSASFPQTLGTAKATVDGLSSANSQRGGTSSISKDLGDEGVQELKKVVSQEKDARESVTAVEHAVPEQAIESREASPASPSIKAPEKAMPNLGSIMKGSDFPEPEGAVQAKPEETPEEKVEEKVEEKLEKKVEKKVEESVQGNVQEIAQEDSPAQNKSSPDRTTEVVEDKLAALSVNELPPDNPDKIVTGAQEEGKLKPADPEDKATITGGAALQPPTDTLSSNDAAGTAPSAPEPAARSPAKPKSNGTGAPGPTTTGKPAPISVVKASTSKPSASKTPLPKSPGVAKLPKTPTTPKPSSNNKPTAKTATPAKEQPKATVQKSSDKAPVSKTSQSSLKSTASTTASAAAKAKAPVVETKKPASKTASTDPAASAAKTGAATSPGGFKKPRPKSPTRPVRLPAHLTAPTAASAAKHGTDATTKIAAKASTVSRPTTTKTATPPNKPAARSSLAPSTAKRPESRTSTIGGADDSFLARMMRPTAASASKVHDKAASPPRRNASVKVPVKPKTGQPGLAAKTKNKVAEHATTTKEGATSGKDEQSKVAKVEKPPTNADVKEHSEKTGSAETAPEVPPAAQGETPAVDNQEPKQEELPVN
ncbi:uncharacterized protein EI97DRAFT_433751 [Westerdykella ornata]|uniref:Mucin-7 n=1 Tax=Westerdykella ornata TaxID=318751 RepID=A0A6A6JIN7_WESOR|nr:uncharacterized protein EI97DRAFT_433751 [Westerdykella ornata]KAF2275808.1 hypothetical protein EI97DRAFT_433751 [Westerdykella ornata]